MMKPKQNINTNDTFDLDAIILIINYFQLEGYLYGR